jgi:hypothetical protein
VCKREQVLAQCDAWVREALEPAALDADYSGLVSSHNAAMADLFCANPRA